MKTVGEWLLDVGLAWQREHDLLRETVYRCQLALPTTQEELKWFDEGVTVQKSGDFYERVCAMLEIGGDPLEVDPHEFAQTNIE